MLWPGEMGYEMFYSRLDGGLAQAGGHPLGWCVKDNCGEGSGLIGIEG